MIAVPKKIPKEKVKRAVDKIHDVLIKEFGKDTLMHAFTIEMINNAIKDQEAVEKIMLPRDSDGKDLMEEDTKINRCRQIIEGMRQSSINLIIFRNEDEVWMQYYTGLFLEKDTIIIALKEEKHEIAHRIQIGGLVKDIVYVDAFDDRSHQIIQKALEKYTKGLEDGSS